MGPLKVKGPPLNLKIGLPSPNSYLNGGHPLIGKFKLFKLGPPFEIWKGSWKGVWLEKGVENEFYPYQEAGVENEF